MPETAQMPVSIHSDIPMDAIGEALLQHYNVGISNPWFEAGYSDQETYNRRKLPWAGKNYTITEDGDLVGDAPEVPAGLVTQWKAFAEESRQTFANYESGQDIHALYDQLKNINPPSTA